jgi:hypothetical protein
MWLQSQQNDMARKFERALQLGHLGMPYCTALLIIEY